MGAHRYAQPMGENTAVGRALIHAFSMECQGTRMTQGEILKRTGKVLDVQSRLGSGTQGYELHANVSSQDHRSMAPGGTYLTKITFAKNTLHDESMALVRRTLESSPIWNRILATQAQDDGYAWDLNNLKVSSPEMEDAFKAYPHMSIIPHSRASTFVEASCTCNGSGAPGGWCKHVASLCFVVIGRCDISPLYIFKIMGVLRAPLREIKIEKESPRATHKRPREVRTLSREDARHTGSSSDPIVLF